LPDLQDPSNVHFTGWWKGFLGRQVTAHFKSVIKVASK
jgi:hypothetical protein